jgi:hypothetical protein
MHRSWTRRPSSRYTRAMSKLQCWLTSPSGNRRRVDAGGLLLGRATICDIVISDPRASGRHALIRPAIHGVELICIGRNPTVVNDKPVRNTCVLVDGDRIRLPGIEFRLELPSESSALTWMVVIQGEGAYTVRKTPFSVGDGDNDDLFVKGWPNRAVVFHLRGGSMLAEANVDLMLGGQPLEPESLEVVPSGAILKYADTEIALVADAAANEKTTVRMEQVPLPEEVALEYMPKGGRVQIRIAGDWYRFQVSEQRFGLLATLLAPPGELAPGDFVPDEVMLPLIWPRQPLKGHLNLNLLVHRVRKDLLKAGLNPVDILQRAKLGGGTVFRLAAGAKVSIR